MTPDIAISHGTDYVAEALQILERAKWNDSDFDNPRVEVDCDEDDFWAGKLEFELWGRPHSLPVHLDEGGEVMLYAGEDISIGNQPEHVWMMLYASMVAIDE